MVKFEGLHMKKLEAMKQFIKDNEFSRFTINSSNISGNKNGCVYSIKFRSVKTYDNPSCIMFENNEGCFAINGIKDISFEHHVLGSIIIIATITGLCIKVICA